MHSGQHETRHRWRISADFSISLTKEFSFQLSALKDYICWTYGRTGEYQRQRNIDLCEVISSSDELVYDCSQMKIYEQDIWLNQTYNYLKTSPASENNDTAIAVIESMKEKGVQFSKDNNIFNNSTSKKVDSFIMDYIHGNSLIFGNCRAKVLSESNNCDFCNREGDHKLHQMLQCEEVADLTHSKLITALGSNKKFVDDILTSKNNNIQKMFIDRVTFLAGQHEFILNKEYEYL